MTMIGLKQCVSSGCRIGQHFSIFIPCPLAWSRFLEWKWLWRIHLIGSIFMFTCKRVLYNDINSQLNCSQTWPKHPISIPIKRTQDPTALGQLILARECQFQTILANFRQFYKLICLLCSIFIFASCSFSSLTFPFHPSLFSPIPGFVF